MRRPPSPAGASTVASSRRTSLDVAALRRPAACQGRRESTRAPARAAAGRRRPAARQRRRGPRTAAARRHRPVGARARPVDRRHRHLRRRLTQHQAQRLQALLRRQRLQSLRRGRARRCVPRAAMPTSFHAPQAMLVGGQVVHAASARQRVEEGVGRHVVALAGRAEHGRHRRIHHKEVGPRGRAPAALGAGARRRRPSGAITAAKRSGVWRTQHAVVEHAGAVQHAAQRRAAVGQRRASPLRRPSAWRRRRPPCAPARLRLPAAAMAACAVASGALRPASSRWRAPSSTSQRAASRPRPFRPPVTR